MQEVEKRPNANVADAKVLRMGTGSIPKLILEFAVPSVCGMMVNGAYNLISSVFLGQAMGETGLAIATAANPTM
ncbi:MAG: MATE family efflux transporter, partial [Eggerthellaceae bacterium]|nr:MATE family efflux transporter [Eggerthellaceae bacterium]